ncbi:MAG TPA: hypothetical protein VNF48_06915 [Gammaproteobacteria bacterium]|nr:hypothetical protein [Gammaproteobacteria bacterium]
MNTKQSIIFSIIGLPAAILLLTMTGCAAVPNRSNMQRASMYNEAGLYNGYCWYDGCAPYIYGPSLGFDYGWVPDEAGGDDGFIGGGEDNFGEGDGGPGQ